MDNLGPVVYRLGCHLDMVEGQFDSPGAILKYLFFAISLFHQSHSGYVKYNQRMVECLFQRLSKQSTIHTKAAHYGRFLPDENELRL